jgi:hypothetical protein
MFNGKYITTNALIEQLYRDNEFRPTDMDEELILEYIYEAMTLMGAPIYVDRTYTITITDYRGTLPTDLYQVVSLRLHADGTPLLVSTDLWSINPTTSTSTLSAGDDIMTAAVNTSTNSYGSLTYKLNDSYIYTNFETGEVDILYKAFPTVEGQPVIPDNTRYILGVKSYIAERIATKLWRRGEMADKVREDYVQQRDWYIGSGANSILIPSIDQMEGLAQQMLTLIPHTDNHARNFRYLNKGR